MTHNENSLSTWAGLLQGELDGGASTCAAGVAVSGGGPGAGGAEAPTDLTSECPNVLNPLVARRGVTHHS